MEIHVTARPDTQFPLIQLHLIVTVFTRIRKLLLALYVRSHKLVILLFVKTLQKTWHVKLNSISKALIYLYPSSMCFML